MGSEKKEISARAVARRKIGILAAVGFGLIFIVAINSTRRSSSGTINVESKESSVVNVSDSKEKFDFSTLQHCSSFKPDIKVEQEFTTKPFWLSLMPFTISDGMLSQLIASMTGNSRGARNYYRSGSGFSRCIGNGESVTCTNNHPYLELGRGLPDSGMDTYNSKYILVLRNPLTNFPATYNLKSATYQGTVGQISEDEWRTARDTWLKTQVEGFKGQVNRWKETKLDLGMYLVYEDLFDPKKGPIVMKKLRSLFVDEGFKVVEEKDLACAWYNGIGLENLQRHQQFHYNYEDYMPAYTEAQRKSMLEEMEQVRKEFESDSELAEILDRYILEIKEAKTE